MVSELLELKNRQRAVWAAGDYPVIAELITSVPPILLDAVGIEPGMRVLDVATGSGNVAIAAAQRGADVVGADLTPELFDAARERAAAAGVEIELVEADAEDMPFGDGEFDRVLSTFGVQFAPRHAVAAAELVRVCAPGGVIGLCNWTPASLPGKMLPFIGSHMPPPPDFAEPPPLWGDEAHVRALFEGTGVELSFERAVVTIDKFGSADEFVAYFEKNFGPTVTAKGMLEGDGRWARLRPDYVDLVEGFNTQPGGCTIEQEYVVIVGRKPA